MIPDTLWKPFSARCHKLLEDMINAEEVQCCRDRDTSTNHKDCLDDFRQMCWLAMSVEGWPVGGLDVWVARQMYLSSVVMS